MARPERKPWLTYLGLPAIVAFLAFQLYDQRPILAQEQTPKKTAAKKKANKPAPQSKAPFALVELFTSEGCSSCPRAEALLNEITADARKQGTRVFTLAFHVDYWDYLGWRDPYAEKRFTQRQRAYARGFRLRSLYTPQMIVGGRTQFVGSSRWKARRAIRAALKRRPSASVDVKVGAVAKSAKRLSLTYSVQGAPKGAVLNVALVQRGLVSKIAKGENSGRTLRHDNVVRAFQRVTLAKKSAGKLELVLPKGLLASNSSLVAYLQDARTLHVLGATQVDLRVSSSKP